MATAPVSVIQSQAISEFCPSSDNWTLWKEILDIYFTEINCEEDNTKKAILLKLICSEAYGVLHSLCSPQSLISKAYKEVCEILATQHNKLMFHQNICDEKLPTLPLDSTFSSIYYTPLTLCALKTSSTNIPRNFTSCLHSPSSFRF